ncbi:hypothetical protein EJ03DRAFT_89165 [Teratosphaeria nubilosa]|uniref:SRR1-like domain-containing protein n=1 Tax=Teratosphaeria nubilosa TaxID=161662 RepID=A0A6G1L9P8_9PEZI|nr:hypothetical protein EJ03DRAFT_89165 [Teratosphaeria nubilosa]
MILKHLDDHKPAQGWNITQAISLALGSPTKNERHPRGDTDYLYSTFYRSMIQLVIFYDIIQHLQKTGSGKIAVFVQDPDFSSLDRELFEALGIKTTRNPEAQAMIDDRTFTYVPYWGRDADLLTRGPRSTPRIHLGAGVSFLVRKELEFHGYEYQVDPSHYIGESDWWPDFRELAGQHEMEACGRQRFLELRQYRRPHDAFRFRNMIAPVLQADELDAVLYGLALYCPRADAEVHEDVARMGLGGSGLGLECDDGERCDDCAARR